MSESISCPQEDSGSLQSSSASPYSHAEQLQPLESGKTKKKRSRVTAEQLAQLEYFFAMDRSPTAARRREIGLKIGISERQIQIWFQNRRAKAKNNEEKSKARARITSAQMQPRPELAQAVQTELARLIQEEDTAVFVIPCTDLTIGTWRRVSYNDQQDLLAWFCERKRCLTWFVRSRDHSFKMQVSLDHILKMEFSDADPGQGFISIILSRPPDFYLRRDGLPDDGVTRSGWQTCEDWTENKQASRVLRHVLGGAALPLAYVVGYIKPQLSGAITLQPLPYANARCLPTQSGFTNASSTVINNPYLPTADHHPIVTDLENQHILSPVGRVSRGIMDCRALPSRLFENDVPLGVHASRTGPHSHPQTCYDKGKTMGLDGAMGFT